MLFFHSKCLILTHIFFFVLQFYSFHIHPNDYFMWSISWASYWISLPKSHVWQCHTIHINPFFSLLSPFFALFASFLPACIRALYQVTSFWKLVLQWNSFNTVLTHVIVHFFFFAFLFFIILEVWLCPAYLLAYASWLLENCLNIALVPVL